MAHGIAVDNGLCGNAEIVADDMSLVEFVELSVNDVKSFVGNGWHIGSIGSWLMFLLSAIEFDECIEVPRPSCARCCRGSV